MSYLLELLGKGLENASLMGLVLPYSEPLNREEVRMLEEFVVQDPGHRANRLRLGIHLARAGADVRAEQVFRVLLHQDEGYVEARLAWAALCASTGELDKAIEQLEKVQTPAEGVLPDSRVLYSLGHCYERQGNTERARQYYQEGCHHKPYLRRNRQRLAAIHLVKQDYAKAMAECQGLQQQHPEDAWLYLALGHLHYVKSDFKEAEDQFGRALTIEPDNFDLHDDQVESLAKSGQIDGAIARLRQLIEQQGDFPDSYVRLGDLYSQLGEDEQAVNHYRRALELHPGYLEAAVKLGTQHLRMGRYYEAAGQFNRATEINDQLIGAYIGLALSQMEQGKRSQADDTMELAAALEPNTHLLFTEMIRLQLKVQQSREGEPAGALLGPEPSMADPGPEQILAFQMERYQKKLQERSNQADLYYHYGLLLRSQGQTEAALDCFHQALAINPSYFKARQKLGLALWEGAQAKEAYETLKQAFAVETEVINLHYHLGLMYCDKIKFALAVEHFQTELEYSGKEGNVRANLSLALQQMGLVDRATAAWQAVCELEPESPLAFQAQRSLPALTQYMF